MTEKLLLTDDRILETFRLQIHHSRSASEVIALIFSICCGVNFVVAILNPQFWMIVLLVMPAGLMTLFLWYLPARKRRLRRAEQVKCGARIEDFVIREDVIISKRVIDHEAGDDYAIQLEKTWGKELLVSRKVYYAITEREPVYTAVLREECLKKYDLKHLPAPMWWSARFWTRHGQGI